MLLDTVFTPFIKERPICVMARSVLERLLDAQRLDTLFERTATHQYTRELLFSSLVQLMSEVVLGVQPSVHAAYQTHKEAIGSNTGDVPPLFSFSSYVLLPIASLWVW